MTRTNESDVPTISSRELSQGRPSELRVRMECHRYISYGSKQSHGLSRGYEARKSDIRPPNRVDCISGYEVEKLVHDLRLLGLNSLGVGLG